MTIDYKHLYNSFEEKRNELDLHVSQVARRSKVTYQAYQRIKEDTSANTETIGKIAKALEMKEIILKIK